MNFYEKVFATFYLANTATRNILNKTESDFIESAKDTVLIYITIMWFFFIINVSFFIGINNPELVIVVRKSKVTAFVLLLIPPVFTHYFLLTKNNKYRKVIEQRNFAHLNWKKRLLVYVLLFATQVAIAFGLILFTS